MRLGLCQLWLALAALPATAQEPEWEDGGLRLCANEEPDDLVRRRLCIENWERSKRLALRYAGEAFQQTQAQSDGWDALTDALNPFKIHPLTLYGNCSLAQAFADVIDYRRIWTCIRKYDPKVAGWDTL